MSFTLPIACAIDQSYVVPLAVLLESFKQHLDPSFRPVLYLIHSGIPKRSLDILSSLVETHAIIPSEALCSSMPRTSHYPREAAYPLLLTEVLPADLERVLFLDVDLLVLDDLAKLWATSLNEHVVAACADSAVPLCSSPRGVKRWRALGIPRETPYFNGGVLLIHLERWRERQVTRRVHAFFESSREPLDFLHQEAMNAVLWHDWQPLDPRWNLLGSHAGRPFEKPASDAWRQPGIVHFSGRLKPWRIHIGGPFYEAYREVLERVHLLFPRASSGVRDNLYGVYDQFFRDTLFPVERYLWRQRLL